MLDSRMSAVQNIAVPPHNLEAEKSVLGAVLLDDRHLNALLVEEHLRPEHFYVERHGLTFAAMLALNNADRKIDHLTVAEELGSTGKLEAAGGPEAIEELAGWVPAAGHARDYGRIVREHSQMRALLTASYEIQASVLSRELPTQELVERAERTMLEVAHDERQKKMRGIADILFTETDKLHTLSTKKTSLTGTPSGLQGSRRQDRRVSAREPRDPRRAPVDGEVRPGGEHRRERGAVRLSDGAVLTGDVRVRARPAVRGLAGSDQG